MVAHFLYDLNNSAGLSHSFQKEEYLWLRSWPSSMALHGNTHAVSASVLVTGVTVSIVTCSITLKTRRFSILKLDSEFLVMLSVFTPVVVILTVEEN
jgi:hypothetical protein